MTSPDQAHYAGQAGEMPETGVIELKLNGAPLHLVPEVDHNHIGRTPRSVPATYIAVGTKFANFALLPESRARGFGPERFSSNVRGGRYEASKGQVGNKVEMNFLPDVFVPYSIAAVTGSGVRG